MNRIIKSVCGVFLLGVAVALLAFFQARPRAHEAGHDPIADIPLQSGWQAHAENPCLSFGQHRSLASWNDPSVLKLADQYVMYMTSAVTAPGQPPVQPFRTVSEDGVDWRLEPQTPLIAPSKNAADFDYQSVETPCVLSFQGQYHMYYTGVQKGLGGPMAIGHATSDDGIRWTKDPHNPVVRPTGKASDFNGLQVAEPGAVVRGDEICLYVTSVGLRGGGEPPVKRVIALAKSADASRFSPLQAVLEQSDLYPAKRGFDGYSTPSAALHDGRVHLFYDVGYFNSAAEHKWSQVALHHAVSDDGETNWNEDGGAIFTRRSFDWTSLEIRSPTALFEGQTLRLWFAGNARVEDFLPDVQQTGHTKKFGIGQASRTTDSDSGPPR